MRLILDVSRWYDLIANQLYFITSLDIAVNKTNVTSLLACSCNTGSGLWLQTWSPHENSAIRSVYRFTMDTSQANIEDPKKAARVHIYLDFSVSFSLFFAHHLNAFFSLRNQIRYHTLSVTKLFVLSNTKLIKGLLMETFTFWDDICWIFFCEVLLVKTQRIWNSGLFPNMPRAITWTYGDLPL